MIDVQHRILGDARSELAELAAKDIRRDLSPPPERSDDSLSRERGIEREMERGVGLEL